MVPRFATRPDMMKQRQQILDQLHTVRDYLRYATSLMTRNKVYFGHGSDNAWDEAVFLLQAALHWPQAMEPHILDSRLLVSEREAILDLLLARVEQRMPLPYLTGRAWFADMPFKIDRRAIIPRSPIAELIEQGFTPWYGGSSVDRVLDLCAGSGCIGIACAAWLQQPQVDLVDLSPAALSLAQENIAEHNLHDQVHVIESDLFAALAADEKRYDIIVSNPPYVDSRDLAEMPAEYRHEPSMALAAGDDGLSLARRILAESSDYLAADGLLVLEVGNSATALQAQYPGVPFTWVDFERGGEGVLVISATELAAQRHHFQV